MKVNFIVGRFQPIHNEHVRLIQAALEDCDKLIIFIGSHSTSSNNQEPKHYFSTEDRINMIRSCFPNEPKIIYRPLADTLTNESWQEALANALLIEGVNPSDEVKAVVANKDEATTESNSLLTVLPNITIKAIPVRSTTSASIVRCLVAFGELEELARLVPHTTYNVLLAHQTIFQAMYSEDRPRRGRVTAQALFDEISLW